MRKGDTVFYKSGKSIVRAKVLTAHRDGSAKVEARFFYDEGKDRGPFLGYKYEIDAQDIHPNAMTAEIRGR